MVKLFKCISILIALQVVFFSAFPVERSPKATEVGTHFTTSEDPAVALFSVIGTVDEEGAENKFSFSVVCLPLLFIIISSAYLAIIIAPAFKNAMQVVLSQPCPLYLFTGKLSI
jgi:hypothetical protein